MSVTRKKKLGKHKKDGPKNENCHKLTSYDEPKRSIPADEVKLKHLLRQSKIRMSEKQTANVTMETCEDPEHFERLILVHGDKAEIWIRYVAHYLSSNSVDNARAVMKRALEQVPLSAEEERLSLWIAYVGMEINYGSSETQTSVISLGTRSTDDKMFLVRVAKMYEQKGLCTACGDIYRKLTRKHNHNVGIWKEYLRSMYNLTNNERGPGGKVEKGRLLNSRAVGDECLKNFSEFVKDKMTMAAEIARLEYSIGQQETGNTRFNQILAEKPGRTDIWLQYLTCVIQCNTVPKVSERTAQGKGLSRVRRTFMNATSQNIKPQKMKPIYKKWLEYEKEYGNAEGIELIKQKARRMLKS